MRRFLLFFIMSITSFVLYSQNWAPINSTEKFCYETDTAGLISHVLWVDSVASSGDHEKFYLNKIAVLWEPAGENTYINYQSEFLLDEVEVFQTGEWYFYDTLYPYLTYENFSIFPYSQLNETWDFTDNITATVSELAFMEILGEPDSVKTISLSSGEDIVLSKNHGIVNWMGDYKLIGIEGRDLGITVPTFDDMFANITTGDVVCYSEGEWIADDQVTGWTLKSRFDINDITHYSDSVVIHAEVSSNYSSYGKNFCKNTNNTEIVIYPTAISEAYPNEAVFVEDEYYQGYVIMKLTTHRWGGIKKTQHFYETNAGFPSTLYNSCDELYFYELCPAEDSYNDYLLFEYTPEYGFLEYFDAGFEWGGHKEIVGVIDDGDTLGTIYPLEMFIGQDEIYEQYGFFVYPSPAKNSLYIKSNLRGQANCRVFDISGRRVLMLEVEKSDEDIIVNIEDLPKGVYILELEINKKIFRRKFIKY